MLEKSSRPSGKSWICLLLKKSVLQLLPQLIAIARVVAAAWAPSKEVL